MSERERDGDLGFLRADNAEASTPCEWCGSIIRICVEFVVLTVGATGTGTGDATVLRWASSCGAW